LREDPMPKVSEIIPCPCGSTKDSQWQYDARGIPLSRTCEDSHEEKMKTYRPDVLTDPNYWTDEDIDED